MTIEKNSFKVSKLDSEFSSSRSRESMFSEDDDDFKRPTAMLVESRGDDEEDEFEDCDSGAGSDDFDLLELGESGEEFCQIGGQTCSIPFELYDLPDLCDILSIDVWNEVLSEDERMNLAKYLPDMDQESFLRTMKELFTGCNLHFGSPISRLFDMLKGGQCEPRVALYRQGLMFFEKHQYYHVVRKHNNAMITNLHEMRGAWLNCIGYNLDEKLRVWNIMRRNKRKYEEMAKLGTESSEREESGDDLWRNKKVKDRIEKRDHYSLYRSSPTLDFPSRGTQMTLESAKYGKQNLKGNLKVSGSKMSATKDARGHFPSIYHPLDMKSGLYGSVSGPPRQGRKQTRVGNEEEEMFEVTAQRDRNWSRNGPMGTTGDFRVRKKFGSLRGDDYDDNVMGLSVVSKNDLNAFGKNRTVNQLSDIKALTAKTSNARFPYDYGKNLKHPENVQQLHLKDQMIYGNAQGSSLSLKGSQIESTDGAEPFCHMKSQPECISADPPLNYGDWNLKSKKGKLVKSSPGLIVNNKLFPAEHYLTKPTMEKSRGNSMQNGRVAAAAEGMRMLAKGEETESDPESSGQFDDDDDDDDDDNPLMRSKWAYPSGISNSKPGPDSKKSKFHKKDKKGLQAFDGPSQISRKYGDFVERSYHGEGESFSLKANNKGKMQDSGRLRGFEDNYSLGPGRFSSDDHQEEFYSLGRSGQLHGDHSEKFPMTSQKAYPCGKRMKGEAGLDHSVLPSSYLHEFVTDKPESTVGRHHLTRDNVDTGKSAKNGHMIEEYDHGPPERSGGQLLGCSSVSKKQKAKDDPSYMDEQDDLPVSLKQQLDDITSSKKRGKRKLEDDNNFEREASEAPVTVSLEEEVEIETTPLKKTFILITPSVHTGFSFSIIHLLSAVRMAMITLLPDDSVEMGQEHAIDGRQNLEEKDKMHEVDNMVQTNGNSAINNLGDSVKANVPSLTVQEIVSRVRSNPGDPCILETQEPLQDLVRGVLKIFSSRTAPLGAKGWKALALYEKAIKSWSWIGPVPQSSSDQEAVEEVTSPDAWGLPHKMLVKLVDSFANWLKSGQETLQQIGSLPPPPLSLMEVNLDEKERFKDLKAQKSLSTINPSSEEVRDYFRKEEILRYSIPDRVFSYTAIDGKKSIVAPLRRCGGKPTSKARDHFMLKRDRPPHVTILCLVRDAAARLPGSIGTRADVCTLIRDSQYVVEDVSDSQVNQIVSGALDRLHYERDPCVQFDSEKKLWVYLHREREEEDFEDDGTSSTKKWKRQKKEAADPSEAVAVTVAYQGSSEQTGFNLSSDLNVEPSGIDDNKREELEYIDSSHQLEVNFEMGHVSEQGAMHPGPSMVWEANLMPTNKDFDDETFGGEFAAELLGAGLS